MLDRPLGLLDAIEDHGIGDPADIEIGVAHGGAEAHERAHAILVVAGEHGDVAVVRRLESGRRRSIQHQRIGEPGTRENATTRIEDQRLREIAERGLQFQHLGKRLRIAGEDWRVVIDVGRHLDDVAAHRVLVLVQIGLGDRKRLRKRRPHSIAEP